MKLYFWSTKKSSPDVDSFLKRPAFDSKAEAIAADLLADIRKNGDSAVLAAVKRIDGVALKASQMRVSAEELEAAAKAVPPEIRRNVKASSKRVAAFAKAGMRPDWHMNTRNGGRLGERFLPFDRVGVYIPGGTAPLASTAVMTATIAKVAGVKEIVACTPCDKNGNVNPVLLYALCVAGATEIYRVGGIQGIGMMAYGTETVGQVQKIVGPGGAFVTAAKRLVYGDVALDLVAGPSEICVIADSSVDPDWIAADLLSQIEHGTGHEKALFITDSTEQANAVAKRIPEQLDRLPRKGLMAPNIDAGGIMVVVVPSIEQGALLANAFAPEHLELMVASPRKYIPKLTAAGAIFVGPWSPEPAGDFAAGPSHVLPTGGAAKKFSGLSVEDFRRRSSIIEYAKKDLVEALPIIKTFGAVEGLDAHARSATIRFEKD